MPDDVLYPGGPPDFEWFRYYGYVMGQVAGEEVARLSAVDVPRDALVRVAYGADVVWNAAWAFAVDPGFIATPWADGRRFVIGTEPRVMSPEAMARAVFLDVRGRLFLERDAEGSTWTRDVEVPGAGDAPSVPAFRRPNADGRSWPWIGAGDGPWVTAFRTSVGEEIALQRLAQRAVLGRWRALVYTKDIGDAYVHKLVDGLPAPVRDKTADLQRWLSELSTSTWPHVFQRPEGLDIEMDPPDPDGAKDCPRCGEPLPADTRFCSECGASQLGGPSPESEHH